MPGLILPNDQKWHGQPINSVRTLRIPKPALSGKNGTDASRSHWFIQTRITLECLISVFRQYMNSSIHLKMSYVKGHFFRTMAVRVKQNALPPWSPGIPFQHLTLSLFQFHMRMTTPTSLRSLRKQNSPWDPKTEESPTLSLLQGELLFS